MDTVFAFVEMGGYGGFVWPAFATTAVVLIGLVVASVRSLRVREEALADLQKSVLKAGEGEGAR